MEKENKKDLMHERVLDYIQGIVESGVSKNNKVPSENFLATKFKISRSSIRAIMNELKIRGLITPQKGSGYYVSEDYLLNSIKSGGAFANANKSEIYIKPRLDLKRLENIIEKFGLPSSKNLDLSNFIYYVKVYYKNDLPIRYSNNFINQESFDEINFERIKDSFVNFAKTSAKKPKKQVTLVETSNLDDWDKNFLFDHKNDLCITKTSMMTSGDGSILEFSEHKIDLKYFKTSYIRYL